MKKSSKKQPKKQQKLLKIREGLLRHHWLWWLAIGGVIIFLTLFIWWMVISAEQERKHRIAVSIRPPNLEESSERFFKDHNVQADAFIVYDLFFNEVIAEKNPDRIHGLASLTKIMTAMTALEYQELEQERDGIENIKITMTPTAIAQPGDNNLYAGEIWLLDDLIAYMLITSSNDAAYAIAENRSTSEKEICCDADIFVHEMNMMKENFNLGNLTFLNASGLDLVDQGGERELSATGSAQSMMNLLRIAWEKYPDIFGATASNGFTYEPTSARALIAENTNVALGELPPIVFSKTGYTDAAGGTLAFIFEAGPGHQVAVVLLGSTFEGRFTDAKKLAETTLKALYYFEN